MYYRLLSHVTADNGNGKERKRNKKAGTVLCTQMEDRTVSFYIKEWMQNRKEPGKEIPEAYSLKEAIYDLGVLGGTKGAPSDGMPGVRSIWQGLDVLYSLLAYRNYLV